MPNLPAHFHLAMQIASWLKDTSIKSSLGSMLLGSSTPDIRSLTKWPRERTHFAPLDITEVGQGVAVMFKDHPELSKQAQVSPATRAFLSGYISHLVADNLWILEIYQPYFGGASPTEEQVRANVWDRALQLELDWQARQSLDGMAEVRTFLQGSEAGVQVGFIDNPTLTQWREWLNDFAQWEFTWDRLKFATRRMYRNTERYEHAMQVAEEFLQRMPDSLEEVYSSVPRKNVASFAERATQRSLELIKRYLNVS